MKTTRTSLALLLIIFLFVGCARSYIESIETVKKGILVSYTDRRAFLDVWGPPERTHLEKGDAILAKWSTPSGSGVFGHDRTYDVWEYPSKGTTLYFDGYYLINWRTDRTTMQLKTD